MSVRVPKPWRVMWRPSRRSKTFSFGPTRVELRKVPPERGMEFSGWVSDVIHESSKTINCQKSFSTKSPSESPMKTQKTNRPSALCLIATLLILLGARKASAVTWTGANSSITNGWTDGLNWDIATPPGSADQVIFGTTGVTNSSTAVNNLLDAPFTISSFRFEVLGSVGYHTTLIDAGASLNINGTGGNAIYVSSGISNQVANTVRSRFVGPGTLTVTNPTGAINITSHGANSDHPSILDLSDLTNFIANVSQILIATTTTSGEGRLMGTMILGATNYIRTAAGTAKPGILIGCMNNGTTQKRGTQELLLGPNNVIHSDMISIGGTKMDGRLAFRSGLTGAFAVFRGSTGGTDRVKRFVVGDQMAEVNAFGASGTGASQTSSLDTTGNTVDILATEFYVARGQDSGNGISTATCTFNQGTIEADYVYVGTQNAPAANQTTAFNGIGTLNVSGAGKLVVNNTLVLSRKTGTNIPVAVMNVSGTVAVKGSIISSNGISTLSVNGGNLRVDGQIGRPYSIAERPLNNFNLTNATLTLTLRPTVNATNPICSVTNLSIATALTLNLRGFGFETGQYPLIKYYGASIGGNGYSAIVPGTLPTRTGGYFSNNVAAKSIDFVVTNASAAKWDGTQNGDWDIALTTNWVDSVSSAASPYFENLPPGDSVIFDDSATGLTTVNLATNVSPAIISITNSSKAYFFGGDGKISGETSLNKNGDGLVILTNSGANDFSGVININDGTLRLGLAPDRLPTTATVKLADVAGAALELGDQDQTLAAISDGGPNGGGINLGTGKLTLTGSSTFNGNITGSGVIQKSSGTLTLGGSNTYSGGTFLVSGTTLLVNTAGSGLGLGDVDNTGTLSIGNGGPGGKLDPGLYITNNGTLTFNTSDDLGFTNTIVGSGVLAKVNANTVTLAAANAYTGLTTISDGGLLITDSSALGDPATSTTIASAAGAHLDLAGGITVTEKFTFNGKAGSSATARHVQNVSGTNTLAGEITGNTGGSVWAFRSDAGKLIVSGVFANVSGATATRTLRLFGAGDGDWATDFPAGAGNYQVRKEDAGTWTLSAFNSYTSETLAYGGTLLVNGTISSFANVIVGDPAAGTPATLGGTGTINGPLIVNTNGTLAPGASIGTLTINNTLTNLGTMVFELNSDTLEHDMVVGLISVTYGGTLVINPIGGGTAMTNGASFQLFSASSYGGAFDAIQPAVPASGLAWDTSQLLVSGTLSITAGPDTTPTNLTFGLTGGQLEISWPSTHTGWRLEGQTNTVNVGISNNWFTVPGSATTNHVILPVDSANGAVFYRLVYP